MTLSYTFSNFSCNDLSDQTAAQSRSFLMITLTSSPYYAFTQLDVEQYM